MWALVDLLAGQKAIKSKWVFKRKADGCFHTWLVAKGLHTVQGVDYDENVSPVARFEVFETITCFWTRKSIWSNHKVTSHQANQTRFASYKRCSTVLNTHHMAVECSLGQVVWIRGFRSSCTTAK